MTTPSDGRWLACQQMWCVNRQLTTPARTMVRTDGRTWRAACDMCLNEWQLMHPGARVEQATSDYADADLPGRITVLPMGPAFWASWDRRQDEALTAAAQTVPAPSPLPGGGFTAAERAERAASNSRPRVSRWLFALGGAVSIIAGLILAFGNVAHGNDGFSGQGYSAGNAGAEEFGIFLIVAPIVLGLGWAAVVFLRMIAAQWRRYKAWKATLSPADRARAEAAEIAALWAGWGAVHYGMKAHSRRANEQIAAMRARMNRYGHGPS